MASVLLHGGLVALLLLGPELTAPPPGRQVAYTLAAVPRDHKLIWYHFRKQQLPNVSPRARTPLEAPRGRIKSADTLIATPKDAPPGRQFIRQPDERKIEQEVRAPNMIAVKRPERQFEPPAPKAPAPAPTIPAPPEIAPRARMNEPAPGKLPTAPTAPTRLALRKFVPPPERARMRLPEGPALEQAPTLAIGGTLGTASGPAPVLNSGLAVPGKPKPRAFVAPPAPAARGGGGPGGATTGTGTIDLPPSLNLSGPPGEATVAIVGLNPAAKLEGPIPPGSRLAQLSAAPNTGAPGGGVGDGGLVVPDLLVRGGGAPSGASVAAPPVNAPRITVYQETLPARWQATFSVPLRSVSGRIPQSIDGRFRGRDVYTMVIPIENLAGYSGDWVLWFADREQRTGATPQMRAPMPLRKVEPMAAPRSSDVVEGRVQLAATIRKDGRLEAITPVRRLDQRFMDSAVEDLQKWEFRPAMRDGTAVDVDVVLEIPFRLQLAR